MLHRKRNKLIFLLAAAWCVWQPAAFAGQPSDVAKAIAIQNSGRVKAFDSFCRQTVETITGHERWNRTDAVTLVLNAVAMDDKLIDLPWVQVNHAPLRRALGLAGDKRYFSYGELLPSLPKIKAFMKSAKEKRDAEKSTDAVEKEAESLYARLVAVKDLMTGDSLQVLPPADDKTDDWVSPYQNTRPHAAEFKELVRLFSEKKWEEFSAQASRWTGWVDEATGGATRRTLQWEVLY